MAVPWFFGAGSAVALALSEPAGEGGLLSSNSRVTTQLTNGTLQEVIHCAHGQTRPRRGWTAYDCVIAWAASPGALLIPQYTVPRGVFYCFTFQVVILVGFMLERPGSCKLY